MSQSLVDEVLDRVRTMAGESIVVVDPDGMVRSLPVLDALRVIEVDAVSWEEPLESRLAWEEPSLAGGRLVVVEQPYRVEVLPADVLQATSRMVAISADQFFGPLDRSIIVQLDWADREAAHIVARQLPAKVLSRTETASQLLRRLYRLDPDVMSEPAPLLEGLLRYHLTLRGAPISKRLAEEFAVAVDDPLPGLRTVDAVVDRDAFVAWLQSSWDQAATEPDDGSMRALLLAGGPAQLLDDYFDGGILRPVDAEASVGGLPFGVSNEPGVENRRRVASGVAAIGEALDAAFVTYDGWRAIAERWAEVLSAQYTDLGEPGSVLGMMRVRLNEAFVGWLFDHYAELATLPSVTVPAMVHRASRVLEAAAREGKVALVVVDGLSIAVWRTILPIIRGSGWQLSEAATFAWLPTITSISRQAIFAGRPPSFFSSSIGTTSKEAMLWRAWWSDTAKLPDHEIGYASLHLRNLGENGALADPAFAGQLGCQVLGVVVEDVDHEIHGERLGEGVLHAGLRTWAKEGHLSRLLGILLDEGYRITLTSDHGFIEAKSVGVSQSGATADAHGRFEVFSDPLIEKQAMAKSKLEARRPWTNFGLPPNYLVAFAPLFGVLKPKGDHLLTHGGPTIEEVIVPWVTITT